MKQKQTEELILIEQKTKSMNGLKFLWDFRSRHMDWNSALIGLLVGGGLFSLLILLAVPVFVLFVVGLIMLVAGKYLHSKRDLSVSREVHDL